MHVPPCPVWTFLCIHKPSAATILSCAVELMFMSSWDRWNGIPTQHRSHAYASPDPMCDEGSHVWISWARWYRDPNQPIPRTDITRFPHAVLEVKLSLPEGQTAPEWVTDLTESGFLTEVGLVCMAEHPRNRRMKGSISPAKSCLNAVLWKIS